MAWRPPYQPQPPHTTCGVLVAPHRGHTLRDGTSSRHAEARRLRVFDLEVFFLGTAMTRATCSDPLERGPGNRTAERANDSTRPEHLSRKVRVSFDRFVGETQRSEGAIRERAGPFDRRVTREILGLTVCQ